MEPPPPEEAPHATDANSLNMSEPPRLRHAAPDALAGGLHLLLPRLMTLEEQSNETVRQFIQTCDRHFQAGSESSPRQDPKAATAAP